MRINLEAYQAAFAALPASVREAEVCADLREECAVSVSGGAQTGGESFARTTFYLRAGGDKTGTVLSEKPDEDPYALMAKALSNGEYSQAEQPEPMNGGQPVHIRTGEDGAGPEDLLRAALALEAAALSLPEVAGVESCTLRKTVYARRVLNTKGLDRSLENICYTASLELRARRTTGHGPVGKAQAVVHALSGLDQQALAAQALADANSMDGGGALQPIGLPSGQYAAVLSNAVTRNIMITAWQALSGGRMLDKASVFGHEPGSPIGSEALHMADDPTPQGWAVNFSLDSEGGLCRRQEIVRSGRLVTPLHTLQSGLRAGMPSTGNAGRVAGLSGTTPIHLITIPSVLYILPGQHSREQLIQEMGTGFYLTYSLDVFHSINLASGEFSIPCGGIFYRDGVPVGTADQLTIAGNLRDLFGSVRAAGNDLALEEFMFYRNYGYGGPSLLVDKLAFTARQQ